MTDTLEQVSGLLHKVGETHHRVFRIVDGADDDWASWYAWWLINLSELPDLLKAKPVRARAARPQSTPARLTGPRGIAIAAKALVVAGLPAPRVVLVVRGGVGHDNCDEYVTHYKGHRPHQSRRQRPRM